MLPYLVLVTTPLWPTRAPILRHCLPELNAYHHYHDRLMDDDRPWPDIFEPWDYPFSLAALSGRFRYF